MDTMGMTIAVLFTALGWLLHMGWDAFLDWLERLTGLAGGVVWDLLACVGLLALLWVGYQAVT